MKNNKPPIDQLLDSLVQHGKNARRQEKLMAQIDHLEAAEKRHRLLPVWISTAIAASIALILIIKPAENEVAKVIPQPCLIKAENPRPQQPAPASTPLRMSTPTSIPQAPVAILEDTILQQVELPLETSVVEEYICLAETEIDTLPTPAPAPELALEHAPEPEYIIIQTHSLVACDRKRKIPTIDNTEKNFFGNPIVNEMPLFALNF